MNLIEFAEQRTCFMLAFTQPLRSLKKEQRPLRFLTKWRPSTLRSGASNNEQPSLRSQLEPWKLTLKMTATTTHALLFDTTEQSVHSPRHDIFTCARHSNVFDETQRIYAIYCILIRIFLSFRLGREVKLFVFSILKKAFDSDWQ